MHFIKHKTKTIGIFLLILVFVYTGNMVCASFTKTNTTTPETIDVTAFAGSASCVSCHKSICDSQLTTAHYLTSMPAALPYIKGSFKQGKNEYVLNRMLSVKLDSSDGLFTQTAFINGISYQEAPFDIVIGSGRKGQTYLYWRDNKLFQLPISYYAPLNTWCNSPGFPENFLNFDREIHAQCLECHGTYARAEKDVIGDTHFDTATIIYGVQCERCHGPAAAHVAYQKAHVEDTTARYIIQLKKLSRQQNLDACALCHSGFRTPVQPAFAFKTGDKLDEFSSANYSTDSTSMLDVHGNQFGLLTASKCFKMSQMDCASCHNVHVKERDNMQVFSERCISCHKEIKHTSFALSATAINTNCIDCHMPLMESRKIVLQLSGNQKSNTADLVRTHRVAIYGAQTSNYLKEKGRRK